MLATFNLQLSTLDLGAETPALQGVPPIDGESDSAGFAALLQLRVADATTIDGTTGEGLPATGNPLPDPAISITLDGMAVEGSDAETPLLPVADEQPWESLVTPPGLELREFPLPTVAVSPLQTATPETTTPLSAISSLVDGTAVATPANRPVAAETMPAVTATALESAQGKTLVTPLPVNTTDVSRELIADARDTRIAPGIQLVVAREIQPRELNMTQVQPSLVQDDGQPVLQDTAARPAAAPLQQIAPVPDELAEPPRPVVQPGTAQAPTPTPILQPGALAQVTPAAPQSDSTFSSTLQNQLSDLIETPVRDPNWGDRIGERVVMMANNQLKTAEIRLTPAELGPVRVQVNVEDGATNITFQAQHAMTREAIEQALPRLREMFAENGLSLGQASVGEQNVAGNSDDNARGETHTAGQGNEALAGDDDLRTGERLTRRHEGLLDTFV